jgi:hypothetical protein
VLHLRPEGVTEVLELLHVRPLRVPERDAQDLLVPPLLVPHPEEAHGTGPDPASGERGLPHEDQGVEGIAVLAEVPSMKP